MSRASNYGSFKNNLITKNNPLDPIFVPTFHQTMQKSIQQPLMQSRLSLKRPSLSFSDYSKNMSNIQLYKNTFFIKEELKPHQPKSLSLKISQIIKSSLAHSKTFAKIQDESERSRENSNLAKKNSSFSAYVNARKKMSQKRGQICSGPQAESKEHSLCIKNHQESEANVKTKVMIEENVVNFELINSQSNEQISLNETQVKDKKQKYLQKLIFRNRKSELIKKQRLNMLSPIVQGQFQAQALKNGFLKLIKKRKRQDSLIIKNKKKSFCEQVQSQKAVDHLDHLSLKFSNSKSVDQEDIQLEINKYQVAIQRNELNRQLFQPVHSKGITILEINNNKLRNLYSLEQKSKLQIASITKIMTCFLVIIISQTFNINMKDERIIVNEKASKMQGTSAKLAYSDICSVFDLLHGLMLPSGNDAAISLGQWGGKTIRRYSFLLKRQRQSQSPSKSQKMNFLTQKRKSNLRLFIFHMNKLAKQLKLKHTHFVNTHGLMNQKGYSCSQDISILTYITMKNKTFREIVGKKEYSCKISNRTFSHSKEVLWENTNKLLSVEGFVGTKTGVTPSAGPCLTSVFQLNQTHYFIITILNTKSCEMRFKQTIQLLKSTFQALKDRSDKVLEFENALIKLQQYNRLQLQQDDRQMMNNMLESTSQSDKEQDEQCSWQKLTQKDQQSNIK